jgi:SAM-dependent methyltransferase
MKSRESGMPDEDLWASSFDADEAIARLIGATALPGPCVEFGCGYGTFTIPAARRAGDCVTALDIDPQMVECLRRKADVALHNIRAEVRDFVEQGTAMVYNLLHLERPVALLREAYRVLRPGGTLSVIHWRTDIATPRGPSLEIRPTPDQCRAWMAAAGFHAIQSVDLQRCCPYHFGLVATR